MDPRMIYESVYLYLDPTDPCVADCADITVLLTTAYFVCFKTRSDNACNYEWLNPTLLVFVRRTFNLPQYIDESDNDTLDMVRKFTGIEVKITEPHMESKRKLPFEEARATILRYSDVIGASIIAHPY